MERVGLPQKIRKILDDFVQTLRGVYGEEIVSVILYGSLASGEYADRYSNVNLAVVLTDTSLNNLAKISHAINDKRFRAINPVFFTESYIKRSTDVFPIEFLDMKENHIVLYGRDVLEGLQIEMKNLRFQCEQELKSKLLNIKRHYMSTRGKAALRQLLFRQFTSSLHILRNLIRLKGLTPPYSKQDLLKIVSQEFHIDAGNLNKILEAKNSNLKLSHKEIDELFFAFVAALEEITGKIDRF